MPFLILFQLEKQKESFLKGGDASRDKKLQYQKAKLAEEKELRNGIE